MVASKVRAIAVSVGNVKSGVRRVHGHAQRALAGAVNRRIVVRTTVVRVVPELRSPPPGIAGGHVNVVGRLC